jgi:5-methylcytosine-specific restriction endonuclease McrA
MVRGDSLIKKICEYCNKEFTAKKNSIRFCSRDCSNKSRIKPRAKYICAHCGKEFERLSSQVNGKYDIYCSTECQNKGYGLRHRGENHHRYNPNLTDEDRGKTTTTLEYIEWRKSVFKRDNYTCQCCGDSKGGNLNGHHLNSRDMYPQEKYDVNNGITLCDKCHKDFHHIYGYGNNTKEQYSEFIHNNKPINYHC